MGCSECAGHRVEQTRSVPPYKWSWTITRGDRELASRGGFDTQADADDALDDALRAAHAVAITRGLYDEAGTYIGPDAENRTAVPG